MMGQVSKVGSLLHNVMANLAMIDGIKTEEKYCIKLGFFNTDISRGKVNKT
jgi:hypothetical protein